MSAVNTDELNALKKRAQMLGITHHPSIGLKALKEKVNANLEDREEVDVGEDTVTLPVPAAVFVPQVAGGHIAVAESRIQKRMRLKKEASRLVRIVIYCNNPDKKAWEGEIFTASNSFIGTEKKYVPYGNEEGWHVPRIIVNMIQARECQIHYTKRDARGNKVPKRRLIKEFNVTFLDDLTAAEIDKLAIKQAMAKGGAED